MSDAEPYHVELVLWESFDGGGVADMSKDAIRESGLETVGHGKETLHLFLGESVEPSLIATDEM